MWINKMNDNNVTRDRREELGIVCYKVPALHVKQQRVMKEGLDYLKRYTVNHRAITKKVMQINKKQGAKTRN